MAKVLTERNIAVIRADPKPVTTRKLQKLLNPKKSKRHRDLNARVRVRGEAGKLYEIQVRKNPNRETDFSVIALLRMKGARPRILFRCNGCHRGPHPNRLEIRARKGIRGVPANRYHIHILTERYQKLGHPDGYAEPTTEFSGFRGAVQFACDYFGFCQPEDECPLFKKPKAKP